MIGHGGALLEAGARIPGSGPALSPLTSGRHRQLQLPGTPIHTSFVPHYAMSGGTLIALSAAEIVMGPNAVLGPVDPQTLPGTPDGK